VTSSWSFILQLQLTPLLTDSFNWQATQLCVLHVTACKRNCISANLRSFHTLRLSAALKDNNVLFPYALPKTHILDKHIIMAGTSQHSFSLFVSVGVKHFTRSDGINQLWRNEY